jgi:hypothetical protein
MGVSKGIGAIKKNQEIESGTSKKSLHHWGTLVQAGCHHYSEA